MGISPGDLEAHFMHELERLYKINGTATAATHKRRIDPSRPPALPGDSGPEGRWEVCTIPIVFKFASSSSTVGRLVDLDKTHRT